MTKLPCPVPNRRCIDSWSGELLCLDCPDLRCALGKAIDGPQTSDQDSHAEIRRTLRYATGEPWIQHNSASKLRRDPMKAQFLTVSDSDSAGDADLRRCFWVSRNTCLVSNHSQEQEADDDCTQQWRCRVAWHRLQAYVKELDCDACRGRHWSSDAPTRSNRKTSLCRYCVATPPPPLLRFW